MLSDDYNYELNNEMTGMFDNELLYTNRRERETGRFEGELAGERRVVKKLLIKKFGEETDVTFVDGLLQGNLEKIADEIFDMTKKDLKAYKKKK